MAYAMWRAEKELREMTKCSICMNVFNDPRMLPCIHTFCFQCLNRISEVAQMKPGDKMACPLCRKDFVIPDDGVEGVQKNFFMENLLGCKSMLKVGNANVICDTCNVWNEGKAGPIPTATMCCLQCQDNYCDSCVKVHQYLRMNRNHQLMKIGSATKSEMMRSFSVKSCSKHIHKPLDYYCADCKKIVCVSCFVETHKSHDCKDVTTVDEEFRQTIERRTHQTSRYADEIQSIRKSVETRKTDFLTEIAENEKQIYKRNQDLKDMIDRHTTLVLGDLSELKSKHLKEMENEMEEIERCSTILKSFNTYCAELISKGSPSDICSTVDQLIVRADELVGDHEAFLRRSHQSIEVSFQSTDLRDVLQMYNNLLGQIKGTATPCENYASVTGLNDSTPVSSEDIKINLHRQRPKYKEYRAPNGTCYEAADMEA